MSVSSRMLRKFIGEQDGLAKNVEDLSDGDEVPYISVPRLKNVNRYGLLNADGQAESEEKEEVDVDVDADGEAESSQTQRPRTENKASKRKVRKKKKHQQQQNEPIDDDWGLDDIEANVGNKIQAKERERKDTPALFMNGILAIDKKNLNPKNELKRIFGSRAIQANEARNKRGRNRKPIKNLWLVPFREQWAMMGKSGPELYMTIVEKKDGVTYFKYKHSTSYQAAENQFLACVESMDPDELMVLVNNYPFHVNTLIQLSEMSKMTEEFSIAAQLIERALYALECGFHVSFNFKTPCRLDYKYQENRALFIALFNHLTFVGQRACYRTALELCKVLLSLSPDEDPLAIVLAVDFYAIRGGEYRWLLQFIEEAEASRNLSQLPNFAYSRAVAHFYLDEADVADQMLQDAIIMFPGLLLPLLNKCNVNTDVRTTGSNFFLDAEVRQSTSLKQLSQLYVGRNYHIWKDPKMLLFLERNTQAVLDRVDKNDPLIKDYAAKRTKRFECRTPRAVERHILLSDIKDVTITETGTTFNFDPLPPLDSVNIYTRPERPRRRIGSQNTLALFFRSLMPTFNAEDPVDDEAEQRFENAAAEVEGAIGVMAMDNRASLQRSMNTLLHAMRDLISTIRSQEEDGDAGDNASSDGEEDSS